jgi:hypothetical protein
MSRLRINACRGRVEQLEQRTLLDANSLTLSGALDANVAEDGIEAQAVAASGFADAADVLPDLVALASEDDGWMYGWSLDTTELPGRRLLRLTTATGNLGDGAMEIYGGAALPGGQQEVYQRIYDDMGGSRSRLAGTFTYHPGHGHTHFDDFAQYHLREVTAGNGVGDIVVSGDKTSFCLLDSVEIVPGPDPINPYDTCTPTRQGISPGWADIYHKSLPDQWIDITGVPDGSYWLEVVTDPDNHMLESNESNNAERILVELITPVGDRFEVNNTFATATDLGLVGNRVEADLSIHESADEDFYEIAAGGNGNIDITTFFAHAQGDIDMALYDSEENFLDDSTSTDNMEQITVAALAGETFYLKVYGFSGDTNIYDLEINGPLMGDYNGDGSVGGADYVIWRKMENTSVTPYVGADGNGDGFIDHHDYAVWQANFGQLAPAGSGSSDTRAAEKYPASQLPIAEVSPTIAARTPNRVTRALWSATSNTIPYRLRGDLLIGQLYTVPKLADAERLAGLASMASTDYAMKADDEPIVSLATALDKAFDSFM